MAISPQFALSSANGEGPSETSRDCIYSFDLHGNLIEMNATFAETIGYDRDKATRLNLSQLLDQESWQRSREQVLALLGGGGTQKLDLTAIGTDASVPSAQSTWHTTTSPARASTPDFAERIFSLMVLPAILPWYSRSAVHWK